MGSMSMNSIARIPDISTVLEDVDNRVSTFNANMAFDRNQNISTPYIG